jgi:hypothetical protein
MSIHGCQCTDPLPALLVNKQLTSNQNLKRRTPQHLSINHHLHPMSPGKMLTRRKILDDLIPSHYPSPETR